jgi:hypothetical protein
VAALQLRQHPVEAGKSLTKTANQPEWQVQSPKNRKWMRTFGFCTGFLITVRFEQDNQTGKAASSKPEGKTAGSNPKVDVRTPGFELGS